MASDGRLVERKHENQYITILVMVGCRPLPIDTSSIDAVRAAVHASSAAAALQISTRHGQIDLLLADIAMACTNGPQLTQHIRALKPKMHLLFM